MTKANPNVSGLANVEIANQNIRKSALKDAEPQSAYADVDETAPFEYEVRNLVPELIRKATNKEFLTKEEVKEMTGWSDRTLQNLRNTWQIPFNKHGKKILYPYDGMMHSSRRITLNRYNQGVLR